MSISFYHPSHIDYSPHEYNLSEATHYKIIYPSLDPSVFEVKFPDNDIIGAVI